MNEKTKQQRIDQAVAECLLLFADVESPAASIVNYGNKLVEAGWSDHDIQRVIVRAVGHLRRVGRSAG